MALAVVGAGFGRTGTFSVKQALEQVGYGPCYHMFDVYSRPDHTATWLAAAGGEPLDSATVLAGYRSTIDWPACNHWQQLLAENPEAKVLLTRRPPDVWFESFTNTIVASLDRSIPDDDPERVQLRRMARAVVWSRFGDEVHDRDHVLRVLADHEAEVIAAVPPDQLLVFEVTEGWEPLCTFLDVEAPAEPFPRSNSTAEFRERSGLDL